MEISKKINIKINSFMEANGKNRTIGFLNSLCLETNLFNNEFCCRLNLYRCYVNINQNGLKL